jgi:hypothetical protein
MPTFGKVSMTCFASAYFRSAHAGDVITVGIERRGRNRVHCVRPIRYTWRRYTLDFGAGAGPENVACVLPWLRVFPALGSKILNSFDKRFAVRDGHFPLNTIQSGLFSGIRGLQLGFNNFISAESMRLMKKLATLAIY